MYWADTAEELIEEHHKMFANRSQCIPTSVSFISANIYDNPVLMEVQPEYIGNLLGMGKVEQAKYLHGCWDAELEGSGYWKREWCEVVPSPPLNVVKKVRAWDLAGTLPSDTNPDPDFTCGALVSKDRYGNYYVEDVIKFRARHGEVFDRILKTAREDGDDVLVSIPREIGVAGKAYTQTIIRDLAEYGFYAKAKPAQSAKVTRFAPFCACSEQGAVKIVAGDWNEDFFEELQSFDGNRKKKRHDDQVDAVGDAFMMLAANVQIPVFSIPDMKASTPYDFAS
jgi:predicted phage terminase large subunit-like protein